MLNEPLRIKEFKRPLDCATRDDEPEKFKGGAIFLVKGFKTERQRIQEQLSQQEFLDLQPMPQQPEFRARNSAKDINPRMYFQPRTSLDRVQAAVVHANVLSHPRAKAKSVSIPEVEEERCYTHSHEPSKNECEVRKTVHPRDIFPSLHKKTHFQAVSAIMTRAPQKSLVSPAVSAPTSREPSPAPNLEMVLKQGSFKDEEAAYIAKEVLQDCRVLSTVRSRSFVKARSGRLVSNPEVSVSEVYSRLPARVRRSDSEMRGAREVYGL